MNSTSPITAVVSTTPTPTASQTARATSTTTPSLKATPSAIPTHSLDQLRDKLPSAPLAYGFVVLEMPESVGWHDMITVTIFTGPGADCMIYYFGTSGLSHATGLEPQIADENGICSWTWQQATILGKTRGEPFQASIKIFAGGTAEEFYLTVK